MAEVLGNIIGLDNEGTDRKSKDEIVRPFASEWPSLCGFVNI